MIITLQASRFIVDYDDFNYKYYVYTRTHDGIEEITKQLTDESKDELIEDLIYALKRVLEQNIEQ